MKLQAPLMKLTNLQLFIIFFATSVTLTSCGLLHGVSDPLTATDALLRKREYQSAIDLLRVHISERINSANLPAGENPYFYLILIADIELSMSAPENAIKTCEEAEHHAVDHSLILDRYRSIAHWYVAHKRLKEAFELLQKHKDRDPLLFNALLDQVSRLLTDIETNKNR